MSIEQGIMNDEVTISPKERNYDKWFYYWNKLIKVEKNSICKESPHI